MVDAYVHAMLDSNVVMFAHISVIRMIPTIWQFFVHKTAQDYALEDIHAGKSAPSHVDRACLRWPKFNFLVGTLAPLYHAIA